jgi:TRAP-type C4-dicarboxylate transport system substrate-binding protein
VITTKAWERIPADLRPALLASAQETARKLREQTRSGADRDVQAMEKRGLTVVHVDSATEATWRKTAEAAYPRVREVFVPGAAFDAAIGFRDEFRKAGAGR